MIKQMDDIVSDLAAARRLGRRIAKYWRRVIIKTVIAATLPIWLIPYLIYRRRYRG